MDTASLTTIRFSGYSYDTASRDLTKPDGSRLEVSGKAGKLLQVLGQHLNSFVPNERLISLVWPHDASKDEHHLTVLKRRLVTLLGDDTLIENRPGLGYRLVDNTNPVPARPKVLLTFPGILAAREDGTIPSWVGHGQNDWTEKVMVRLGSFQKIGTPSLKTLEKTIHITFRHKVVDDNTHESWWTASVPLGGTTLSMKWMLVDIRGYNRLCFDAEFISETRTPKMLLGVRLEDGSLYQRSKSRHNQTGWYPEELWIGSRVRSLSLDLANFDWSVLAWPDNIDDVDRERMLQVDFGQDDAFPNAAGVLKITNLRLE